jgi:hypothetical protein
MNIAAFVSGTVCNRLDTYSCSVHSDRSVRTDHGVRIDHRVRTDHGVLTDHGVRTCVQVTMLYRHNSRYLFIFIYLHLS